MATYNGTDFVISQVGSPNKKITSTRTITMNIATATIDVSTRDSLGWKESIPGQKSWGGSITGVINYTEGSNESSLKSLLTLELARTIMQVVAGTTATGSQNYTGAAILTNIELTNEYEGTAEWTADLEGTGALVISTVA